jgi:hypothetical protein
LLRTKDCCTYSRLCVVGAAHTGEIAAGVAGGLLLFLAVVLLVLYRNWRYEQELDSLLWKVDYRDIQINEEQQVQAGSSLSTKISRVSMTPCRLVQAYGPSVGTQFLHLQGGRVNHATGTRSKVSVALLTHRPEDGSTTFFRNINKFQPDFTASSNMSF